MTDAIRRYIRSAAWRHARRLGCTLALWWRLTGGTLSRPDASEWQRLVKRQRILDAFHRQAVEEGEEDRVRIHEGWRADLRAAEIEAGVRDADGNWIGGA